MMFDKGYEKKLVELSYVKGYTNEIADELVF